MLLRERVEEVLDAVEVGGREGDGAGAKHVGKFFGQNLIQD